MILSEFKKIKISAIVGAVPSNWTSIENFINDDNRETVEKFSNMTGVKGRYNVNDFQTTSDLAFAAARELLEKKNIELESIGAIVYVTQSPDYAVPSTACVLQYRLGLSKECMAFDVNLGCSGYTYGLNIVASLMNSSNIAKALLLAGDTSAKEKSRKIKTKTANAFRMLFGDAGSATLLEKTDEESYIDSVSCTDGSGFKAIIKPFTGYRNPDGKGVSLMNDIDVFNFTISEVPKMLKDYMKLKGLTPDDYDSLVMHQANLFILKQIAKKTKFPMDKVPISIDTFGNTSSASIPISLIKEYGDLNEDRNIKTLMCGFGVGLSWSLISADINIKDIYPLVKNDDYFLDGYENETDL
ncbi:MAG: ketoacyl-ACP synthase III [Ignavibacteriales bacterium]|nr:ketoacyl-ACP synthase III [Ignavibacteriales bacterium]